MHWRNIVSQQYRYARIAVRRGERAIHVKCGRSGGRFSNQRPLSNLSPSTTPVFTSSSPMCILNDMRIIVSNICFDLKLSAAPVLPVRFRCVRTGLRGPCPTKPYRSLDPVNAFYRSCLSNRRRGPRDRHNNTSPTTL